MGEATLDEVRQALASHPFSRGMGEAQLQRLAACARLLRFPPGAFLLREGGEADTLYLLLRGRVGLEQHLPGRGPVQLENLHPGDVLGLSWLFPGRPWMLDARAVEPVEVLALEARCVREQMEADATLGCSVATHLLQQLYERLARVRLQRLDLYRAET